MLSLFHLMISRPPEHIDEARHRAPFRRYCRSVPLLHFRCQQADSPLAAIIFDTNIHRQVATGLAARRR